MLPEDDACITDCCGSPEVEFGELKSSESRDLKRYPDDGSYYTGKNCGTRNELTLVKVENCDEI